MKHVTALPGHQLLKSPQNVNNIHLSVCQSTCLWHMRLWHYTDVFWLFDWQKLLAAVLKHIYPAMDSIDDYCMADSSSSSHGTNGNSSSCCLSSSSTVVFVVCIYRSYCRLCWSTPIQPVTPSMTTAWPMATSAVPYTPPLWNYVSRLLLQLLLHCRLVQHIRQSVSPGDCWADPLHWHHSLRSVVVVTRVATGSGKSWKISILLWILWLSQWNCGTENVHSSFC